MKTLVMLGGAVLALAATPVMAQDGETDRAGDIQFKVLGTAVLPDGKITDINVNLPGLPATLQTKANDNFVPTLAVEWFVTDNVSIETIAGTTQHDVDTTGGLPAGARVRALLDPGNTFRHRPARGAAVIVNGHYCADSRTLPPPPFTAPPCIPIAL
jgi:outer membrane protein W